MSDNSDIWYARIVGGGFLLVGIATAGFQAYGWLKYGYWTPINLSHLGDPDRGIVNSGWIGLDEVLRWFGRQSVALVSFIIGFVLFTSST